MKGYYMSNEANSASLISGKTANLLLQTLKAMIGLSCVSVFFSVLNMILPHVYENLVAVDAVISIGAFVINVSVIIIFLVWMFKLHKDFANIYGNYPITPGTALARLMVPFYNLWGIWNVYSTMAKQFISEAKTKGFGQKVQSLIPLIYIAGIISNILNRLSLKVAFNQNMQDSTAAVIFLAVAVADLVLVLIWFNIAQAVVSGVNNTR